MHVARVCAHVVLAGDSVQANGADRTKACPHRAPDAGVPRTTLSRYPQAVSTATPLGPSKHRDDVRPDRDHADEQNQRGQHRGLLDDGADHQFSPRSLRSERTMFLICSFVKLSSMDVGASVRTTSTERGTSVA